MSELIGSIAAFLTTVSFLPQALKTLRTRRTHDISFAMYFLFSMGVAMWLAYGLMIRSLPIIVANSVTLCLVVPILIMKIIYK